MQAIDQSTSECYKPEEAETLRIPMVDVATGAKCEASALSLMILPSIGIEDPNAPIALE